LPSVVLAADHSSHPIETFGFASEGRANKLYAMPQIFSRPPRNHKRIMRDFPQ
jgi:hypothetical protein